MVDQQLVNYALQRKFMRGFICVYKHYKLIDANQSNIDVKENGDECEPIQILVVIVDEVTLVPILHVALVQEAQGALDLVLHNKSDG